MQAGDGPDVVLGGRPDPGADGSRGSRSCSSGTITVRKGRATASPVTATVASSLTRAACRRPAGASRPPAAYDGRPHRCGVTRPGCGHPGGQHDRRYTVPHCEMDTCRGAGHHRGAGGGRRHHLLHRPDPLAAELHSRPRRQGQGALHRLWALPQARRRERPWWPWWLWPAQSCWPSASSGRRIRLPLPPSLLGTCSRDRPLPRLLPPADEANLAARFERPGGAVVTAPVRARVATVSCRSHLRCVPVKTRCPSEAGQRNRVARPCVHSEPWEGGTSLLAVMGPTGRVALMTVEARPQRRIATGETSVGGLRAKGGDRTPSGVETGVRCRRFGTRYPHSGSASRRGGFVSNKLVVEIATPDLW